MTAINDEPRPVVLVADDDPDILSLVSFRLESSGYDVVVAEDGETALRLARERKPDLCVLDVMMPNLTGLDVTRALRADEKTRDVRIILLTARVQESDVARGLESGADDYVKKPFSPRELGTRVAAILGR
jgi:DNA-binding response OmpR family regulator